MHYKDADFGDDFFSLLSLAELMDKGTIRVVYIQEPATVTLTLTDVDGSFSSITDGSLQPPEDGSLQPPEDACSSVSSQDTLPVSSDSESSTHRSKGWPSEFPIPHFSSTTEIQLQSGNENFTCSGTLFGTKDLISPLPDILGRLAEAIYEYTAYPSSAQCMSSIRGPSQRTSLPQRARIFQWMLRMNPAKYKMNNFRSKLRGLGCPEIVVNSLQRKPAQEQAPAKNIKKPKKAELNYLPPHPPQGETNESLEKERLDLLLEVTKRDNCQVVAAKMAKTFSLRRQEIIHEARAIRDFMERWPALFDATQVSVFKAILLIN